MSEYINRLHALDAVCEICPFDCTNEERAENHCVNVEKLMSIPSADAVQVRHGRWIEKAFRIMCSDCGAEFKDEILYMIGNDEQMSYCPNCGARMDGENDE